MKDYYAEQLVKRYDSLGISIAKLGVIFAICLSLWGVSKSTFWMIATVALVVFGIILFGRMDVEYEYLFINDELSIDKVMAKSKRKTLFKVHMRDVELIAPVDSGEARPYQKIHIRNYSSRRSSETCYLMIVTEDEGCIGVKLELNQDILKGMIQFDSNKVVLYGR